METKREIEALQNELYMHINSDDRTSDPSTNLASVKAINMNLLKKVCKYEKKLSKIADIIEKDPQNVEGNIKSNFKEMKEEISRNLIKIREEKILVTQSIEEQKQKSVELALKRSICYFEEISLRSFHYYSFRTKPQNRSSNVVNIINKLFFSEEIVASPNTAIFNKIETAKSLTDTLLDNLLNDDNKCDLDRVTFGAILVALFDYDDSLSVFVEKLETISFEIFLERVFPILVKAMPYEFLEINSTCHIYSINNNSFLRLVERNNCKQLIMDEARNEIKTSLTGSKTKFTKYTPITEIPINNYIFSPNKNIFLDYKPKSIAKSLSFIAALAFGTRRIEYFFRDNWQSNDIKKYLKMNNLFDLFPSIPKYVFNKFKDMIEKNEDIKIVEKMMGNYNEVREILKKEKNYYAANTINFATNEYNKFLSQNGNFEVSEKLKDIFNSLKINYQESFDYESFYKLKGKTPENEKPLTPGCSTGIAISKDGFTKRKGDEIKILEYVKMMYEYGEPIFAYQKPLSMEELNSNIFREVVAVLQYNIVENIKNS